MKKIIYIICSVVIFFLNMSQLNAQIDGSHLMFDMGGGVHTMLYNPNWGESKIGMGGKIGLNYAYYFHKNFGAGIGAYCNLYTSRYKLPDYDLADGKKQTDESNYNYTYVLYVKDHLNETQRVASISIPISFRTQFQLGWYWDMRVNVGAAVEIPMLLHKYYSEGNLTTTAYYEELNVLFHDMPNHGFKKDRYNVNGEFICKKVGISPFAEIGFSRMIDNHWRFYLGVYASLSATNFIAQNENDVFYDSTSDKYPQNSFSSDLSDKMRLFKAGATIGFVYQFKSDDRGKLVQAAQYDLDTLITPEPEVVEEEEAPKVVVVPVDTTCEDVIDINYKWLADSTAKADGLKIWTPSTNSKKSQPASMKSGSSSKSNTSSNNSSKSSAVNQQTAQKQEQTNNEEPVKTEPTVVEEEKSKLQIESDIPAQKIGSVTVRKKKIKARCSNAFYVMLEFKDPGEAELTPSMQNDLQMVAKYLKSNPKAKVTLEDVTSNSAQNKYLIKKNMVYFSKIKNQLISYGVRPNQVVYSGN